MNYLRELQRNDCVYYSINPSGPSVWLNKISQKGQDSRPSPRGDPLSPHAQVGQERGAGNQGERNSSGISNRGMDRSKEQADLPSRGSSEEDWNDQSER